MNRLMALLAILLCTSGCTTGLQLTVCELRDFGPQPWQPTVAQSAEAARLSAEHCTAGELQLEPGFQSVARLASQCGEQLKQSTLLFTVANPEAEGAACTLTVDALSAGPRRFVRVNTDFGGDDYLVYL